MKQLNLTEADFHNLRAALAAQIVSRHRALSKARRAVVKAKERAQIAESDYLGAQHLDALVLDQGYSRAGQ